MSSSPQRRRPMRHVPGSGIIPAGESASRLPSILAGTLSNAPMRFALFLQQTGRSVLQLTGRSRSLHSLRDGALPLRRDGRPSAPPRAPSLDFARCAGTSAARAQQALNSECGRRRHGASRHAARIHPAGTSLPHRHAQGTDSLRNSANASRGSARHSPIG